MSEDQEIVVGPGLTVDEWTRVSFVTDHNGEGWKAEPYGGLLPEERMVARYSGTPTEAFRDPDQVGLKHRTSNRDKIARLTAEGAILLGKQLIEAGETCLRIREGLAVVDQISP